MGRSRHAEAQISRKYGKVPHGHPVGSLLGVDFVN